jgi:glutathione S-transferase
MILHEKQIDLEVHEVDLNNMSEEFQSVSPYGKVPVLAVNGISLYESNVVNEYLDEVHETPRLMLENPEQRALARSWMAFADDYFFPFIFRIRMGLRQGFSEEQLQEAREKLQAALSRLERQLEGVSNRRVYIGGHSSRRQLRSPARARGEERGLPRRVPERRGLDGAPRRSGELLGGGLKRYFDDRR